MKISEKLINYTVYRDGSEYLGVADVTLPSFESVSETIKGAGIAGEIDSPTIGHFGSMTCTLNWRTIDPSAASLAAPKTHALDFRGSQQVLNTKTGEYGSVGVKVSVRAIPKKFDIGKFEMGATTDSSNELEVVYIKVVVDGKTLIELDKFNSIYIVDGTDYMASIRSQLGQ